MAKKLTEVHSLTIKLTGDPSVFKDTYEQVFNKLSKTLTMPMEIRPAQVILDMIAGNSTLYVLRHPKVPAYKMNEYIFSLAKELKVEYDLSTVILKRTPMYVDPENVPETLAINKQDALEIIKKAQEDELFSEKYKEKTFRRRTDAEITDALDKQACAYAEKVAGKTKTVETVPVKEEPVPSLKPVIVEIADNEDKEKEIKEAEEIVISEIQFSIEKNGQLCLVF